MTEDAALIAVRGRSPRRPAPEASPSIRTMARIGEAGPGGRGVVPALIVLFAALASLLCAPVLARAAAPPEVVSTSAGSVSADAADLLAGIDPQGEATSYHFEYGTTSGYGAETASSALGAGETTLAVSQHLQGLSAATTYHYRVVADSTLGTVPGADNTFTTQTLGNPFALPDGRAWELVTPPDKRGAGIRPTPLEGGLVQAAQDGGGLVYVASAPVTEAAEGNRSEEAVQTLATRGVGGWNSQVLTTPNTSLGQYNAGEATEYKAFSPDLAEALLEPRGLTALPPLAEGAERTIYLRDSAGSGFTPLVTAANVNPGEVISPSINEHPEIHGFSADLSHVVFSSTRALTPEVKSATVRPNLYEWYAGKLQLVSALPDGRPASEPFEAHLGEAAELGQQNRTTRAAVSADGSRVIWESGNGEPEEHHLYLRDLAHGETVQLDSVQGGTPSREPLPRFRGANSDGTRIFFSDSQRLTPGSHANLFEEDLYVAEVTARSPLAVTVTDLTEGPQAATVRGSILGNSEDGSVVYYVAQARLTPAAPPGPTVYVQSIEGGTWGSPRVISALSEGDEPDWNQVNGSNVLQTARVSPDGRYLAFMSRRPITGYDNRDLLTGEPDEEVFLYSLGGGVRCVSCNPTGGRPTGLAVPLENHVLEAPLVDLPKLWQGSGLAASVPAWSRTENAAGNYQPRYLSDSGRVYFDAADSLVPADTNGKEDAYQYEPEGAPGGRCNAATQSASQAYVREAETEAEPSGTPGVASGCVALLSAGTSSEESVFLDASESDEDVFLLTASQLTSADTDGAYDIYDAHQCSASSPCLAPAAGGPPPCSGAESCRGTAGSGAVIGGEPASAGLNGPGNPKPRSSGNRTRQRKRALGRCRKKKGREQRVRCEREAKKKFGPGAKSTSKRGSK